MGKPSNLISPSPASSRVQQRDEILWDLAGRGCFRVLSCQVIYTPGTHLQLITLTCLLLVHFPIIASLLLTPVVQPGS
ncbi:hypothetical protein D4764_16G0010990 [Takifugu flavidus]|uniref:Uncharacterized protein n=1 Tax=Takifugu flavidus TaxID=433684 RepID=A0A5C6NYJ7_9TELE|nr:hypothetical protein D4764_16G0010990 [Takifugu flavidus]